MEIKKKLDDARMYVVKYLNPAYLVDCCRLRYHRRLADGGRWAYFGIFLLTFAGIIGVAFALILQYGSFCAAKWQGVPDYMGGKFEPENALDAAGYLLFTNGGQNLFDGSHLWGFLITCLGILIVAFFTSKVTSRLERKAQRYLNGETWYRMTDHIVIFGVSDYLYSIIDEKSSLDSRKQKFLIVTNQDVEKVRREVFSFLQEGVRKDNFVFLFGDRTSKRDISKLSLRWAKEVYVIGDSKESDDIESYRDANNMECIKVICDYLSETLPDDEKKPDVMEEEYTFHVFDKDGKDLNQDEKKTVLYVRGQKRPPLPCHVMFEYQTTFAAFQFCDIPDEYKDYVKFLPFNYYDLWARKVIVGGKANGYEFLDTLPGSAGKKYIAEDSDETVHLIVLGMAKMGIAMALQAAHVCHYPNFVSKESGKARKRTRITFVDSNADVEMDYFKGRFISLMQETRTRYLDFMQGEDYGLWKKDPDYKWCGDEKGWYDIEWEFIKGRIESDPVRDFMEAAVTDSSHIVTVAVCLPKSHQSIAAAMYLPETVLEKSLQVLVFQRRSGKILDELSGKELVEKARKALRYKNIRPFGVFSEGYDSSLDDDARAKMVSYVYDSYFELIFAYRKKEGWDDIETRKVSDVAFQRYHCDDGFMFYSDKKDPKGVFCRRYADYDGVWRKKKVEDKMSSMFNANSIGAKLRGIGVDEHAEEISLTDDQLKVLARVEHNRWNIEKMLTGYRALTDDEVAELNKLRISEEDWVNKRKEKKNWPHRAHLDICSVEELNLREEKATIDLDTRLSEAIPTILKIEKK